MMCLLKLNTHTHRTGRNENHYIVSVDNCHTFGYLPSAIREPCATSDGAIRISLVRCIGPHAFLFLIARFHEHSLRSSHVHLCQYVFLGDVADLHLSNLLDAKK